jgi:hypothetical protein
MRATSKGKKEGFVTSQKTAARRSGNRAYKYNHKKKPGKRLEVRFCIKDENRPAVVAVGGLLTENRLLCPHTGLVKKHDRPPSHPQETEVGLRTAANNEVTKHSLLEKRTQTR